MYVSVDTYNSRNYYYTLDQKSYGVTFEPTTVGIIIP